MNIENLNQEELKQLQTLLNKMNPLPTEKVYLDPVNKMIHDITENFNFARVQNVMGYLDWKWHGENVTMDMLRETAERLLRDATKARLGVYKDEYWEKGISCGTGGFQATAYCDEDKTEIVALDLKFVLEYWESEIE